MDRLLAAPPPEEVRQGVLQQAEPLEVVVVRHLAAQPLPDRLDRIQVGAVGRQEAQPQAWLAEGELDETGAAVPGCPIEDDDHQHRRISVQQLTEEPLAVGCREPRRQAPMEASRHHVQGPEAVDLLVRARPVAGSRLFAREAPLPAEGRGELDGDLVLEEDGQAVGSLDDQAQESSDLSFFSRWRQGGTVGS